MAAMGRILFADDETIFLESMGELLRNQGYACDCVSTGISAARLLQEKEYDLLISDIKMPGNVDLELIREAKKFSPGMPVILVTAHPSFGSAVQSIELPVVAYLIKPFHFEVLLQHVQAAMKRSANAQLLRNIQQRLQGWRQELDVIAQSAMAKPAGTAEATAETFITLTLRSLAGCLNDLQLVTDNLMVKRIKHDACQLLQCPNAALMTEAMYEAVRVLEKTKRTFKSQELAELRKSLEATLASVLKPQHRPPGLERTITTPNISRHFDS